MIQTIGEQHWKLRNLVNFGPQTPENRSGVCSHPA